MKSAVVAASLLGIGLIAWAQPAPESEPLKPTGRQALEPVAPIVPAEIVAALQEKRFPEAIAALDRWQTRPEERSYAALIGGIARRLAGQHDAARDLLKQALTAEPNGPWAAKLRSELTAVELATGRFAEAEALSRSEAETLLADGRKDRLARIYQQFAAALLKPAEPVVPADPEGAHALLDAGRHVAKGRAMQASLLLEMARASQAAGNHARAISEFQGYLDQYARADLDPADLDAARFGLGESQLAAGQHLPARLTWDELVRNPKARNQGDFHPRAMFEIARTYQIPNPPDETQLNLGIAALRRFLTAYSAHPLAVRAAYEIGAAYLNRNHANEALGALQAFIKGEGFRAETEAARREQTERTMAAAFQVGQILQRQGKFDQAIAAFQGYLAQYPNGPQSADAQRSILDTRLAQARDHADNARFPQARQVWQEFAAANPLDGRVPEVLFLVGETYVKEKPKKIGEAIAAWELLASKFPNSEPAGHGQFETASLFETEKGDPATAIERFKKIEVEPWRSQAQQRIAVMERRELIVETPRAFRSGETPHLKITTRNLEKLTFTAYKLDPEAYFRKKHALDGVESLDIGLVAPDTEWTAEIKEYAKYKPIETTYDLKTAVPGVWVVKVSDEKHLQATTLVLGSDLDAIVKASRDQVLVFVQDMKTGKGRADARVLVAQGEEVLLEAKTGPDGVVLQDWAKPRDPNSALRYLVLDGPHAAGSGLEIPQGVAQGLSARAYLYTDRPAYRPGQAVRLRGIVREVKEGQYDVQEGASYRLEVSDSQGRPFLSRPVALSRFGTVNETFSLDPSAPVGSYRVRLYQPGKSEFAGQFEVQAYQLQKVDLTFDLPRSIYYRGETIEGAVVARYQYGTPLANRPISLALPDGRTLTGATDATGRYAFRFPTEGYGETQSLTLQAALPQDNVAAIARVMIAVLGFGIDLDTARSVYLDGESFPLTIQTRDALGEPIGQELTVTVLKRVTREGTNIQTERETFRTTVKSDAKTGQATLTLKVDDRDGGPYVIRVAGTDRFGNPIVADRALTISGARDEEKLRILADRQQFKVGEKAEVRLVNRGPKGTALLAWEADRVLAYKLVPVNEGENPITWEVDGKQFPNFTLTAAAMAGTNFHEARLDVAVERDLKVTVKPVKESVGPGETVEVEVTTTDQLGRPVAAEVALAVVDHALLRLFRDRMPPIGRYFYDQQRVGAFTTEATNTFRYKPTTTRVPDAVVEEAERLAAVAADDRMRALAARQAQPQAAFDMNMGMPAPAPAPPATAGTQLGMAGGGYRGKDAAGKQLNEQPPRETAGTVNMFFQSKDKMVLGEIVEELDAEGLAAKRRSGAVDFSDGTTVTMLGRSAVGSGRGTAPRQAFVETAYWNPSVVTGPDGKAKVTFTAPMALSRYQLAARGVTGADTLVGQTTAELSVKKDFFVDLKRPAVLTQGDRPRFIARLHHVGVKGQAAVALKVYAGEREQTYPKTIEIKEDGSDEILFDSFEVPDGDLVRIALTARLGDASDDLVNEVPIQPWGVQAYASASGSASNDATAIVSLPPGRAYENPEMLIVLSPTIRRMLVELALGRQAYPLSVGIDRCFPVPPDTIVDRASDLLAASSVLAYLRSVRSGEAPEAVRLAEFTRGLAGELLTLQNEDGGWPWVAGAQGQQRPSDRLASARAFWALSELEPLGLLANPGALDKAATYLTQQFSAASESEVETRSALLHALSARKRASFEQANALNRIRQSLSDAALAYLALTFANLDRASLASEVLGVLGPRAKTETAGPGQPARIYWNGDGRHPGLRGPAEATALAALAYARSQPQARELAGAVEWLMAHRVGTGWVPHKAKGPALAALSLFHGKAAAAEDRYRLVVTVNDQEVHKAEVLGSAEGQVIAVPRRLLRPGGENRVRFDIDGRGTFGYAVTLTGFTRDFGPDQNRANRTALLQRRITTPADPEFDGKPLSTGFSVAVGANPFENVLTQLPLGGRARVKIDAARVYRAGQPAWEQDFLIIEEHLPAGATLVDGSIQSNASHYTIGDGTLTFYYAPEIHPGEIRYDIYGYLPGQYRALPPEIRSAYEPSRRHLGPAGELKVLAPGETSTDPYKPTPDELYARGKAMFDAGRLADAAAPLEALWNTYTLQDNVAKDAARMLLFIHLETYDPRKIVQYFEYVRDKSPELVISFEKVLIVGRAYRDLGEYERASIVWRGIAEASYLEDARLGEVLRQRGQTLEGLALLLNLWREYPNSPSIESDFFGLAQLLARLAEKATTDPALRKELAAIDKTRSDLLLQAIRLTQVFLSQSPTNPVADEASLALVGAFLELEDYQKVVDLAERYARLYPRSTYFDSFQYSAALGMFHLGRYDQAIETAEKIAAAVYKDANGVDQPSPNKWQALYIIGQIHDARQEFAKAVTYYQQVSEQFTDASEAVKALTRKGLKMPEVTLLRPPAPPKVAGAGLRAVPPVEPQTRSNEVKLDYRNIAEVDVKVYPVDLMRLYLTRRNLEGIASIDLAGITPLLERTIKLGDGQDFEDRVKELSLPLTREGAYLVMARGENLYASGIALLSPLEMEVIEEPGNGRVRVTIRDAATGAPVPKVLVKVIGTDNTAFFSGETDLRGVFVAEGVIGQVTAVARQDNPEHKDAPRYAFHRGTVAVGAPPAPRPAAPEAKPVQDAAEQLPSLEQNLQLQNRFNQERQIERLEKRYNAPPQGGAAAGGFR